MSKKKIITRTILLLGLVSLFTDISSEMLYPVMPVYLKSIGYSALWIGILEGLAEGTAGLSKGYFGKLSDDKGRRMPFVRLGYFLSGLSKPLLVLFIQPFWILSCRVTDRLGKGIRTGARDAVLSDESEAENRGRVFGFHRGMDTLGAAIGPMIALAWLWFHPGSYRILFFAAFLPALTGVFFTLVVKEKGFSPAPPASKKSFFSFLSYWKNSQTDYRKVTGGLILFALFNSSDVFLLLMAKQHGLSDIQVIAVYIFYNLIYALFSYPFGVLADKWGKKLSMCIGLFFFIVAYVGMSQSIGLAGVMAVFFSYGLYAAATDGVSKAWISGLVPQTQSGSAQGFLAGMMSLAAIVASAATGLIWQVRDGQVAFLLTAGAAAIVLVYFILGTRENARNL
jgi:MFS family permease